MASWKDVTDSAPAFAGSARELFDVHKHKTLATLRKDGSPRISGIEISFADGELWLGGMWKSKKCLDLRADPRFALHGPTVEPDAGWKGDVKLFGRAVEIEDPARKKAILQASGGGSTWSLPSVPSRHPGRGDHSGG